MATEEVDEVEVVVVVAPLNATPAAKWATPRTIASKTDPQQAGEAEENKKRRRCTTEAVAAEVAREAASPKDPR